MEHIKKNIEEIKRGLKEDVALIAVTKTYSTMEINKAIDCGITNIGENKVQEILDKFPKVKPVKWHFIGHLQTNKVKQIIDKVHMIHSVDSEKLADEINKRALQHNLTMDILVQVNEAEEESKFGVAMNKTECLIDYILENCSNIRVKGLMNIAPFEENTEDVRQSFNKVNQLFLKLKEKSHPNLSFEYLSMGMSHDYQVAVEEGSNMVRIGSKIFGRRTY